MGRHGAQGAGRAGGWGRGLWLGAVVLLGLWVPLGALHAAYEELGRGGCSGYTLLLSRQELLELMPGPAARVTEAPRYVVPFAYEEWGGPETVVRRAAVGEVRVQEFDVHSGSYATLEPERQAWFRRAVAAGGEVREEDRGAFWLNVLSGIPRRAVVATLAVLAGLGVRWWWRRWAARLTPGACRQCGYPCRGIPSKRCPECGEWLGW